MRLTEMNKEVTLVFGSWSEFSRSNTLQRWNLFETREESRGPNLIVDRISLNFRGGLLFKYLRSPAFILFLFRDCTTIYHNTYSLLSFRLKFKRYIIEF